MLEDRGKKCNISVHFSANSYFLFKFILAHLMKSEDYLNINTPININIKHQYFIKRNFLNVKKK